MLYTFGGFEGDTGQTTLQAYNTQDDVWQSISVHGGPLNKDNRYWSMHASSSDGGGSLSFISGGQGFMPGTVIFNSSKPQQPSWVNVTNDNIPYFWGGTTQYVRFGSAGVLLSVGGFLTEPTSQFAPQRREMNSVQVYDIAAEKWSTIFARGDIPPPRSRLCSALIAAPDDSSFQMIIHGGWDEQAVLEDVYMLILPAFHWIKINTTANKKSSAFANKNESMGRMDHFCSTYKDRQMLVLGGKNVLNINEPTCDTAYPPLRMLDMTTFQWQTQFPLKDTTYRIPQAVIDVVGGGYNGGAKPASSWQQTLGDNVALFSKTITKYDPDHPPQNVVGNEAKPNNGAASYSNAPSNSRHRKGVIAGAVVGGVVGLGFLGATIYFLIVRTRQRDVKFENREPSWHKPELARGSVKPSAAILPFRSHEVEGDDPVKMLPREMDGANFRLEAPSLQSRRGEAPHELSEEVGEGE